MFFKQTLYLHSFIRLYSRNTESVNSLVYRSEIYWFKPNQVHILKLLCAMIIQEKIQFVKK